MDNQFEYEFEEDIIIDDGYDEHFEDDFEDNFEYDPYITIEARNLPPENLNQRMAVLVGFVVILVALFGGFVIARHSLIGEAGLRSEPVAIEQEIAAAEEVVNGRISPIFSPEVQYWADEIVQWSADYNIDPNLAATIMQIESCGDPQAISNAGAQGLFQVMPYHFEPNENTLDPQTNALTGIGYFAEQLAYFGDINLAFAAYNGGPGNAAKAYEAWPNETQRYYYWSKGIWDDIRAGNTESVRLQEWMTAGGASLCRQAAARLGL